MVQPALVKERTVAAQAPSWWRSRGVRRMLRQRLALVALAVLLLLSGVAIYSLIVGDGPSLKQDLAHSLQPPLTDGHLFGTDEFGRDVLARMVQGTRVALLAAVQGLILSIGIGVPLGVLAGFQRGPVDRIITICSDTVMSFPPILLAIAIVGILGPSLTNAMVAIGVIFAPTFMRLARSSVMAIREETYIEAARSIGVSNLKIILRHVVPNAAPPLIIQASLTAGFMMLAEASLSFLGLGVQAPQASWGSILAGGVQYVYRQPWLMLWPGIALTVTVLACNLLGDGLRDFFGRERHR